LKLFRKPSFPSPAMVVALLALFLALGGSAYALVITGAQIRNGSITGPDIRNRSLTGKKFQVNSIGGNAIKPSSLKSNTFPGRILQANSVTGGQINESTLGPVPQATGAQNQAIVNAQGQLVSGRGVAGVALTAPGTYQVTFNQAVAPCAYSGMLVNSSGGAPPIGLIGAATIGANPNAIEIRTSGQNGQPADLPFHLVVSC
jgi:hypothetical protein